ncbi:MAG: aldose epimerase family protein [Woeseiaceae bacterium]
MTSACADDNGFVKDSVDWGTVDGKTAQLLSITNGNGVTLRMTDFGAKIVELHVPGRNGQLDDVVLGFDNLEQYVAPNQSIGATIGRYTNRIRDGRFEIDGVVYELTKNEGDNTIHGGGEFENAVWDADFVENELGAGIRFRYRSPDGSHGFPGNLDSVATYILTDDDAVHVTFEAETDKATHVNFTQHSYFNLNGAASTIHDHVAMIDADRYVVLDEVLATGEIDSLDGKPWDLRAPTRLGDNMEQIPLGGYHHDYVVNKPAGELEVVAVVSDPESGRKLTVSSTQPDVTFYVAMGLTDAFVGKYGIAYGPYMAFCLETQHPVDAANHPQFPSTLLRPGEKYLETVVYDFGIE